MFSDEIGPQVQILYRCVQHVIMVMDYIVVLSLTQTSSYEVSHPSKWLYVHTLIAHIWTWTCVSFIQVYSFSCVSHFWDPYMPTTQHIFLTAFTLNGQKRTTHKQSNT